MSTVEKEEPKEEDPEEIERQGRVAQKPLLSQCYNLLDFEAVARRLMKKTAWAYYSSASDDEIVGRSDSCNTPQKNHQLTILPLRRCVKTTMPSTVSGSAPRSSLMSKPLTSPPECSAAKPLSPST